MQSTKKNFSPKKVLANLEKDICVYLEVKNK